MSATKGRAFDQRLFARVMTFVRPYRTVFWVTFALTILLSGIGVVRPLLMGDMIDHHALTGDKSGLIRMTLVVMALLVIETLVQFYQAYWTSWLGQAVTFDLRTRLYAHLLRFRMRFFDRTARFADLELYPGPGM